MHILSYLFRFDPENEGPSCLKGVCGCVNKTYIKSARATFFNNFSRKKVLKNLTLMLLRGSPVEPNPHFLGSGAREN